MKRILSFYHPKLAIYLVYMLQQVEYNPYKFFSWVVRLPNVTKVMQRQTIVWTSKARALVVLLSLVHFFYLAMTILYFLLHPLVGLVAYMFIPVFLILFTFFVVLFVWQYFEEPRRTTLIRKSSRLFRQHPGIKIAVAGSYGKTSMKELLYAVLSEGKKVAASPGNKNVPISHAAWIKKLDGDEEVLIIEYGEGAPGDIKKLAKLTRPTYGVITGLAPNHLDEYKHVSAVAKDLLSLADFVDPKKLYISADSFKDYDTSDFRQFNTVGVRGWTVQNVKVDYTGTTFSLIKGKKHIKVTSGLLGMHQVGPLAVAAILGDELGLTVKQIETGLSKTAPYEHRMQPRKQHGAWVIDDTYNGSLEGFRAGLALLSQLPAKRKMYVTPGLVEQGEETERVHIEIGELIARANPDRVVLMKNSVTGSIVSGLESGGYQGEIQIETNPLLFYTNLDQVIAAGDLILMQNDWTDNYN